MEIKTYFAVLSLLVVMFIMSFSLFAVSKDSLSSFVPMRDEQSTNIREIRGGVESRLMRVDSEACRSITVVNGECETYKTYEFDVTQQFPLHFLSGAPGSGNDWIRWLATLNRFTPYTYIPGQRKYAYAVYGSGHKLQPDSSKVNTTKFLFFKSHEPWWHDHGKNLSSYAKKAALLLRHPFDACYSEYKREILVRNISKDYHDKKNAAVSVPLKKFIDPETHQLNKGWKRYIKKYTKKWLSHAEYWLVDYGKPLHVIVYNDVRQNTAYEIESMQKFFGYNFDGPNIRRHCCVMADSMNPQLKRSKSDVDSHKEEIFEKDLEVKQLIESSIEKVHKMLDHKFPGKLYRVTRG